MLWLFLSFADFHAELGGKSKYDIVDCNSC